MPVTVTTLEDHACLTVTHVRDATACIGHTLVVRAENHVCPTVVP